MDKFLKIAVVLGAVDKASSVISKAVSNSNKELEKLGRFNAAQQKMDEIGNKALVAGSAITAAMGLAVNAAEESEVATAKLEQVFRSMGDTTGKAADEAERYASALSMQIGVEDEAILAAQTKLATFGKVSNETARMAGIFDRATAAAFDLAAAGFGEAGQNAVQLGKALQDPIKGITALARSGVTFTEKEKAKIKTLVESGKMLEAQKIVLKAIETQVGGTAKASATETQKMKVAFGEVQETVGKVLLPYLNQFAAWLTNIVPKVLSFIENNETLVKIVGGLGIALIAVGAALKIASVAMGIFNAVAAMNPVVAIIASIAIAALLVYRYWDEIKAFFLRMWTAIKNAFSQAWDFIKRMFLNFTPLGLLIQALTKFGPALVQAGKNIVNSIWTGIKAMASKPVEAIKGIVTKIREFLPFSPAKVGPLRDIHRVKIVETIAESMKPNALTNKMSKVMTAARQSMNANFNVASPTASGGGGGASLVYSPQITINGGGSEAQSAFGQMLASHKDEILRILRAENDRTTRRSFA